MLTYEQIETKMKAWRRGETVLPIEYIKYHEDLAYKAVQDLLYSGKIKRVHRTYMDYQGWGDGMKVLHAIIEMRNGELKKLQWHDSHAQGHFMQACKGGGWSSFNPEDE